MKLFSNETLWVFLLASSGKPEIRHLYDIVNGVSILLRRGILLENIQLVIDGCDFEISRYLKLMLGDKLL